MTADYTPIIPTGSTSGRQTKVVATATPGTLIHTADATDLDELWLYAMNSDSVDRKLTIEWGGVTSPDDLIEMTIPKEDGPHLIVPGWRITGGLVVRAFAETANVILIGGICNRIVV